MGCHGLNAVSGLLIPDLRGTAYLWDKQGWSDIVHDGARANKGMPNFGEHLSEEEVQAIRSYVIQQAHRGKALRENAALN